MPDYFKWIADHKGGHDHDQMFHWMNDRHLLLGRVEHFRHVLQGWAKKTDFASLFNNKGFGYISQSF